MVQLSDGKGTGSKTKLFRHDGGADLVQFHSAVFFGNVDPQESELTCFLHELAGEGVTEDFNFLPPACNLPFDEILDGSGNVFMLPRKILRRKDVVGFNILYQERSSTSLFISAQLALLLALRSPHSRSQIRKLKHE